MSLIQADARRLPLVDGCVQCVVTSPPYFGLRDYGTGKWSGGDSACAHTSSRRDYDAHGTQDRSVGSSRDPIRADCRLCGATRVDAQIGLEPTPAAYVDALVGVFRDVRRVLRDDGVLWLNLGDTYASETKGDNRTRSEKLSASRLNLHSDLTLAQSQHDIVGVRAVDIGLPSKNLVGVPWRVAFALQADGWYLRSDVIWAKPNPMPESITDRPTKAHEYLFLLAKSERYYYDADAIAEPLSVASVERYTQAVANHETYDPARHKSGASRHMRAPMQVLTESAANVVARGTRNSRTVWTIATQPYDGAHFATMPEALIEPCILAGSRVGDRVCDPFVGSGTVGAVAERLSRRWVGVDLNPAYHALAKARTAQRGLRFDEATL